jgi:phosphomethylpyrimidine synthase
MQAIEIGSALRSGPTRSCGQGCRTLIIASIGTSAPTDPLDAEMAKARIAQEVGADVVTDHSFCGSIPAWHTALVRELNVLVSTVSCYELAASFPANQMSGVPTDAAVEVFEAQAQRGLDLITVHASFRMSDLELLHESSRIIPSTSKGGAIVSALMRATGRENPYYEQFDRILDVCSRLHVTLSLGTSFRPGSVCDEWDRLIEAELACMGELVNRARDRHVGVMIEGIGHASIDQIPLHVHAAKRMCHGAPYRVLPMATDIALGFDHIAGAIAAATAVGAGADAITCVSRAEHIGLPTAEDLREAIIAARVAAHCGELAKLQDLDRDRRMSQMRWQHGCRGDWTAAVYPQGAREALEARGRWADGSVQCSMCGEHCGVIGGHASLSRTPHDVAEKPL